MTTPSAMLRPFAVRLIRTLVVLAIRLATASTVHADVPGPERHAEDLREAHFARVGIAGRTYVLVRPSVMVAGLSYDRIDGSSRPGRPAIIVGAGWDTVVAPLASPVPWSSIDRIEAGIRTRPHVRKGAIIGLVVAGVTGMFLGGLSTVEGADYPTRAVVGIALMGTVAGAGIGALFHRTTWTEVDAGPQDVWR